MKMNIDLYLIVVDALRSAAKTAEDKATNYGDGELNYAYAYGVFSEHLQNALMDLNLTKKQLAQLQASLNV